MAAPRYGMVVDLNRCVGCQTCTIACKHTNDTPPGVQWRAVLDVERGSFPDVERLFLVVGCQHCADPPCVPVCPTGATAQRADGLVTMDYDLCIGCGYCAVACPYQARTIVHEQRWYYGRPTRQEEAVRHPERLGVAGKCTFCVEKIDAAAEAGATPGVDLDYTPACSAACIAQAIHFGDFNDPASNVSRLAAENAHFRMHEGLGTDPQIKYLYEVPGATPGRDPDAGDDAEERLRDPANPLVGRPQTFWDLRAAMNFTLGGMSSGLAVVAYLAQRLGWIGEDALRVLYAEAAVGMAIGLVCVFLEIGRKGRFLHVLRRPQSSWMTRETYAVAVFYPAVLLAVLAPAPAWHALVALAAAAFLFCQARILYAGKGIPAWRAPLTPWMLAVTGLLEGTGLLLVAAAVYPGFVTAGRGAAGPALLGAVLALLMLGLWAAYVGTARRRGVGPLAHDQLLAVQPWMLWLGCAVPVVGCAIGAALPAGSPWLAPALLAAGAGAVAGGVLWKLTVVVRASHQQGYAVPRMPRRGSGTRAAPVRLEPLGAPG